MPTPPQPGATLSPAPTAGSSGTFSLQHDCIPVYPAVPQRLGWRDSAMVPSPDGARAAQSLNPTGGARLQVTDASGNILFSIEAPNQGLPLTRPLWSPDGRLIAFANSAVSQPGGGDIYVVEGSGAGLRRVATYAGYHDAVAWSPDGRFLAFTSGTVRGAGSGLTVDDYAVYSAAADGSGPPSLVGAGCDPAWRPAGSG